MLCDDIVANGAPGSGCDIGIMLPRIRSAARFILGQDFAAVADVLSSDYTGLVKAFPFCRLPYKTVWIEVAHHDRPQFLAAEMQVPNFQVSPKRIGYLLEATRDDLSAWKAHLFWSTALGCSCPPLAMCFDMTSEIDNANRIPTPEEEQELYRNSILLKHERVGSHPGWRDATEAVKLSMVNHTHPTVADYGVPYPTGVDLQHMDQFAQMCAELARSDWAGEPSFILAVVGLLNARNAVDVVDVDYTKLNRARIKRGKKPMLEHKVLKIAHRQVQRIYPEGEHRSNYAPMRGHFVRGHWKVRKTGIYFWHPHARGSFHRGHIEKEYQL